MRRAPYVIALVALVAVAVIGVAAARRTQPSRVIAAATPGTAAAPGSTPGSSAAGGAVELPVLAPSAPTVTATEWINSAPLAPADLKGKVVLYDFWTFRCINCQNTLSHVKAWYARYAADGLVVVGIHTPEFDDEAKAANVRAYVTANAITYPVALDPDSVTWRAFDNHYWPNFYLHDRLGQRRYTHIGEGAYQDTEDAIRALLGVDAAAPRAVVSS